MVGLVRFELTTSCTPCKRATRLRYSPNKRRVTKRHAADRCKCFFWAVADPPHEPSTAGEKKPPARWRTALREKEIGETVYGEYVIVRAPATPVIVMVTPCV